MNCRVQPNAYDIAALAADAAFGRPLVTNVLRGLIVEAIVSRALGAEWTWCSADFAAWDFERSDGLALEVKQAASRQSWHKPEDRPSRILFDIKPRTGYYNRTGRRIDGNRRWADVYIFAHHHVLYELDHREPAQWTFYVIPEPALPDRRKIALSTVRSLAKPCSFAELRASVAQVQGSPR